MKEIPLKMNILKARYADFRVIFSRSVICTGGFATLETASCNPLETQKSVRFSRFGAIIWAKRGVRTTAPLPGSNHIFPIQTGMMPVASPTK